jgi:hypothetical protein
VSGVAIAGEKQSFEEGSPGLTDIAVTPAGTVAWAIAGRFVNPLAPPIPAGQKAPDSKAILVAAGGLTPPVMAAYGSTIDSNSLAAVPGHVNWTEAGAPRAFAAP